MKQTLVLSLSLSLAALPLVALNAACSGGEGTGGSSSSSGTGGSSSSSGSAGGGGGGGGETPIGGDRPVTLFVPSGYDAQKPTPLLVMLHGYGASGALEELYLNFDDEAEKRGFLYATPDGTVDADGKRFWNATPACCNFGNVAVDDVAYIMGFIAQIQARYNVDPKRIFLFGHSNGGFMSYRMACDHAETFAAIASLAGAMFADPSACNPSEPVSVAQIHGTSDDVIDYLGGTTGPASYPPASESVADWGGYNGCDAAPDTSAPPLDLEKSIAGDESTVSRYLNCDPGGAAELWTIQGGSHIPALSTTFAATVFDFLSAHPKP